MLDLKKHNSINRYNFNEGIEMIDRKKIDRIKSPCIREVVVAHTAKIG